MRTGPATVSQCGGECLEKHGQEGRRPFYHFNYPTAYGPRLIPNTVPCTTRGQRWITPWSWPPRNSPDIGSGIRCPPDGRCGAPLYTREITASNSGLDFASVLFYVRTWGLVFFFFFVCVYLPHYSPTRCDAMRGGSRMVDSTGLHGKVYGSAWGSNQGGVRAGPLGRATLRRAFSGGTTVMGLVEG